MIAISDLIPDFLIRLSISSRKAALAAVPMFGELSIDGCDIFSWKFRLWAIVPDISTNSRGTRQAHDLFPRSIYPLVLDPSAQRSQPQPPLANLYQLLANVRGGPYGTITLPSQSPPSLGLNLQHFRAFRLLQASPSGPNPSPSSVLCSCPAHLSHLRIHNRRNPRSWSNRIRFSSKTC
jgi:hypothetical protein